MPLRETGKTCWPFLPNNEPTWTQPEQVTSPHMATQEVETTQNCIQQPHTWEAHAVQNGLRLLLLVFGFVELFVSPGCKTSLATNQSCHLESCPFCPGCLNSSLKFVVGREQGQTKSQTMCCQLLGAQPAQLSLLSRGMVEYRGSRACHRLKLLRLTRQNLKTPADNKCTERFRLCSLLCRVCCFTSRRDSPTAALNIWGLMNTPWLLLNLCLLLPQPLTLF